MRLLLGIVCAGLVLAGPAAASQSPERTADVASPTLAQMIGQKLVVSMNGTTPTVSLLSRVRAGKVGGVIIHRFNFSSAAGLRSITTKLRRAASRGGQPKLLIAVDQEGGSVKIISWIPPTLSPPQMGRIGSSDTARTQGRRTGTALLGLGVNTDFAPVADVPASTASFMYLQGRTWSFNADKTARLANAFDVGLRDRGAIGSMKHFPGIGFARRNTDDAIVRIAASRAQLSPGLEPYRRAVAHHLPLIMLSNAIYDAYDPNHAAGWSRPIVHTLLREELGFTGATITDSLDGAAHARGVSSDRLALPAARAGTDLLLITGSEGASRSVYRTLLDAASHGTIRRARLLASYRRILALKAGL